MRKPWDGSEVFIPNSFFINHRFTNWSYRTFTARIRIPVSVAYGSDLVIVTELLLQSAYQNSKVLSEPLPEVVFIDFGDSGLNFELRIWINPIDQEPEIRSDLNFTIEYLFRENNISIPFPQTDIWLKNPSEFSFIAPESNQEKELEITNNINLIKSQQLSIKEMLLQVNYFKNFNPLEIRQLIKIGYRKHLQVSEILFRENDPGDAFYIVLSGSVEVYVEKLNKHLADLVSGNFFGELLLEY